MRKVVFILYISFVLAINAQQITPIIHSDNSVCFTLADSSYEEVSIEGSFIKKKCNMIKNDGIWTYTTNVLSSEMHTYRFVDSDDKVILDPKNHNITRDIDQNYNFFILPGYPGSLYMQQNIPHGELQKVWYPSNFNSEIPERRMFVYLPPSYNNKKREKYPVLYLLHGTGGDETSWCEMGRLRQIMDNMISQNLCKPMIVVMPNGIEEQDAAPGEGKYTETQAKHINVSSWMGRTEAAFPTEVVSYVEKHYRVIPEKSHRAIAGLSLGGMHTIAISMNNPDMFDYIGLFSPQTISGLTEGNIKRIKKVTNVINDLMDKVPTSKSMREKIEKGSQNVTDIDIYSNTEEKIKTQFTNPPKVYYIAIGKDDSLKRFLNSFRKILDNNSCRYSYHETEGSHSWENWRKYLLEFLPQLFK